MSPERQRQLLFALLGVLAVVGAWQYLSASAPEAPAAVRARRAAQQSTVPTPPVDVGVALLEGARTGPDDGGRNPFVFGARAVVADTGPRTSAPPREAPPPPAFTAPAGPPPLPPIPFKFIGLVEGASSAPRIAVLSDSKGLVVHGSEGTIIDGRFRILSIGPESVDIAYADGRGRQTLRLSGQ
jgi:hypothetical protein